MGISGNGSVGGDATRTTTASAQRRSADRRRDRRRLGTFAAAALTSLVVLAGCSTGAPTSTNALAGSLTTRLVDVSVSGGYSVDDAAALGGAAQSGIELTYNNSSLVVSAKGTLAYQTPDGPASIQLVLDADAFGTAGSARVIDVASGVDTTAAGRVDGFTADDLGNVAGSITQGSTTVSFSTRSTALDPASAPELAALLAEESTYCQAAQARLTGLDGTQLPISAVINTRESNRSAFASSKSTLSPLTTRSWSDTTDVTTESGDHAVISHHISCKTRAADHLATAGHPTAPADAECSTLNQRSIDLAMDQMTPAQRAAAQVPTLASDVVRQTGTEWTTPLPGSVESSSDGLHAHALLTRWNDPAFEIFPDTIRGVHYCTVWSPAYAYAYLLDTLPAA